MVDTTEDVDVALLRGVVASGGLVAQTRDVTSGEPAGFGLLTTPHEGVSELCALGVRSRFAAEESPPRCSPVKAPRSASPPHS